MTVVAGKVTFGSTGPKTIAIGIAANDITFLTENCDTDGYADHSYQFSRTAGQVTDRTKAVVAYNTSGVKVLEFTVTGWGATTFSCNVTVANALYPFDLIART